MLDLNINIKNEDISSEYYCIHSLQKLNSKSDTNVLSSNAPIKQILKNRDVYLVEDLKGDARWSMNKIIQRNISKKRVTEITDEYLKNDTRLIKFFPAITVVLLPKSEGQPARYFETAVNGFNKIDGINIEFSHKEERFIEDLPVKLTWDKDKISALVIDGQHRVSAIREYYDSKSEDTYKGKSIPVSFIVFDNSPDIDLIQATRALFIDVNNTPRLVSEEKLIFIDDRNLHRRITLKCIGGNNPEEEGEDVYQKIMDSDDFFLNNDDYINRFLIEEGGNDDEVKIGLLSNHSSLMPWEVSKLMTIHKNILANILLKYNTIDRARDIRSACKVINENFLTEIESYNSHNQLTEAKKATLFKRMREKSISENEIEVFKSLINIREKFLDDKLEVINQFMVGSSASEEEKQDRQEFINILENIYKQDCSKDSAFEFSSDVVSKLLNESIKIHNNLLVYVFNKLWFIEELKSSLLAIKESSVFHFITYSNQELKANSKIRSRSDKVDFLLKKFKRNNEKIADEDFDQISEWANNIESNSENNLLRSIVGQETLFIFLVDYCLLLNDFSKIKEIIGKINRLGNNKFFESNFKVAMNFKSLFSDIEADSFEVWSNVLINGRAKKPGLINAQKGAGLMHLIFQNISNRQKSTPNELNKLQRSYGSIFYQNNIETSDISNFEFVSKSRDSIDSKNYLTENEFHLISSCTDPGEDVSDKILNIDKKSIGGFILENIINHLNPILIDDTL